MRYRLGDLTVKDWNSWDRVPRDPVSIGTIIATAVGAGAVGTAIIIGLTYLGITAVTSWAISALMPRPDFSSFGSQGTLVNARNATAPVDFVYGQVRKGGTVSYYESTGDENKFLHQIIVLAGHEVEEIGEIYVNDEIVTIDSNGFVTDTAWDSKIRIQKFKGNQTSAPADLLSESELTGSNALTSNFIGNGIAYLYVRYEYDGEVFASGVPLVTAIVKGKKVFDPRTSSTAYSNNAALCIRDFITSTYGLNDSAIDDVSFAAAANESDENVSLSGAGTEKRYTINGIVKASSATGKVLGEMTTACAGTLFWGSGYWKLKVGAYTAPVKTLTLDDLRSPINLQTRASMRDSFNGVSGTFNDASDGFITSDYPTIKSSIFKAEDGGDELLLDLPMPYTTSASMAQRIAKMTLYRGREQMTLSADFGLEAFNVEVGDIVEFDNARYGFSGKEFEVIGWAFSSNQQAGDLRVKLTLQETSQAAFNWNAEESDIINNNTNLPSASAGLAVNNLVASGGGRTQGDGTFVNSAILNWDNVLNAFFSYYEVEWKALADSTYSSTTTTESAIEISPLVDGIAYIFRVRAITASGFKGAYSTVTFTGGGDVTAPGLPTAITASGHFGYISIDWTNPADADFNFVEVWENTTNASSGSTKVGISAGNTFQRTNLGLNVTRYYFLKSVDYSGNASAFTSSVNATTTFLDDADFANGIYQLFKDQGLYAIKDVSSLPASGTFTGEKVFNTTDGKLYSWTGAAWEATVADVGAGSITATEIQDGAISTPKLAANAVNASKILAGTITGNKITANTITGGLIASSGIITNSAQINNAVITNAKINNAAVDTLKVAGNSVTISSFVSFSNVSGAGPYTFTNVVSMPYAGDVILIANLSMFGQTTAGNATFTIFINGTQYSGITFTGATFVLGLHTLAGSSSVNAGNVTVQLVASGISGITSPSAECNFTILRRFR